MYTRLSRDRVRETVEAVAEAHDYYPDKTNGREVRALTDSLAAPIDV